MKKILILSLLVLSSNTAFANPYDYKNSPYNYDNSRYNYQNSSYNYQNSPYNYNNNPYNPNANIIYDENGKAKGYAVEKANGTGVNYYNFKGKRQGYSNN